MKYLEDRGGYGACHRCDATKSATQIAQCGFDCPFHRVVNSFFVIRGPEEREFDQAITTLRAENERLREENERLKRTA